MYQTMTFKVAFMGKCLPAVITPVPSDSTMYQNMTFQSAGFSKCLPTVTTRVWLIADIPPTVNCHVAPSRGRLSTAVTFVMVLWTSVHMFFIALPAGMVVGTALLQLHEACNGG